MLNNNFVQQLRFSRLIHFFAVWCCSRDIVHIFVPLFLVPALKTRMPRVAAIGINQKS